MKKINNYNDLILFRNMIINQYTKKYNDYLQLKPFNIDSKNDITLDFVNCTICNAKKNISENKIGENYIISQPCLRNNHIDALKKSNIRFNYMGYFTMLGGFCYITETDDWVSKFNEIVLRQFEFFRSIYQKNDIQLTISSQYEQYLPLKDTTKEILENNNCSIFYSQNDQNNLKWKYGLKDVIGYGTRWEIKNNKGKFINCGNDIILLKNNKVIGVDFGSGLETIVSVLTGEEHLLYSNKVCSDLVKKFCFHNINNEKLIDSLTSIICIEYFKEYKSFRIKYLKYCYIKIISAVCIINMITSEDLSILIDDICKSLEIFNFEKKYEIIDMIETQKQYLKEISFSDNIENLIKLFNKRNYNRKLIKYKNNIYDIELEAIIFIRKKEEKNEKAKKITRRR